MVTHSHTHTHFGSSTKHPLLPDVRKTYLFLKKAIGRKWKSLRVRGRVKECTLVLLNTLRAAWLLVAGQKVSKCCQIFGANSFLIYRYALGQTVLGVLADVILLFWH